MLSFIISETSSRVSGLKLHVNTSSPVISSSVPMSYPGTIASSGLWYNLYSQLLTIFMDFLVPDKYA